MVPKETMTELLAGEFVAGVHAAIASALAQSLESKDGANWLATIAEKLDSALHPTLRALAATELPAADDQELARYVSGVLNSGFINLLTRQKLSMQSVLRQLDPADTDKISEIQRELVSIEKRRRKLQSGQ
jgi:DNA primase